MNIIFSQWLAEGQWIEIDVGPPTLITGVITKGRADSKKQHWVTRFKISYSNDSQVWYQYKDAHHADPRVCIKVCFIYIIRPSAY
jgi:lactadherin